jgi:hypothetical protein
MIKPDPGEIVSPVPGSQGNCNAFLAIRPGWPGRTFLDKPDLVTEANVVVLGKTICRGSLGYLRFVGQRGAGQQ